jgi:hypothetical protein
MTELLYHGRSDSRLDTGPNTQYNSSTNEHASAIGKRIDDSTNDAND